MLCIFWFLVVDIHTLRMICLFNYRAPPSIEERKRVVDGKFTELKKGMLQKTSKIRLVHPKWMRLVVGMNEDNEMHAGVCHSLYNSLEMHMNGRFEPPEHVVDIDMGSVGAVSSLFKSFPDFVSVESLHQQQSAVNSGASSVGTTRMKTLIEDLTALFHAGLLNTPEGSSLGLLETEIPGDDEEDEEESGDE